MRKIINSTYVSLDGVIGNPQNWTGAYFAEEAQEYARGLLFSSDALLLGRATYDGFAESWPNMEEQTGDFGVRMNNIDHYVVSDSLEKGAWKNTHIIKRADAVAEVTELKKGDGENILQYGFGDVARTLVGAGLLDELHLWIHPVLVGYSDSDDLLVQQDFAASFEVAETKVFGNGVIVATYVPQQG